MAAGRPHEIDLFNESSRAPAAVSGYVTVARVLRAYVAFGGFAGEKEIVTVEKAILIPEGACVIELCCQLV